MNFEERIRKQEMEEQREKELMLKRAEEQKREFYRQLEEKRKARLSHTATEEISDGWSQVKEIVDPYKKDLPKKDEDTIKQLYYSMKMK